MTEKEIEKAASVLVKYLNKVGSPVEKNLTIGGDTYKPFYRTMSIMWAPSDHLTEFYNGKPPTLAEAKRIACKSHHFFQNALNDPRESKHFESQYENAKESWEDQYDKE